MAIKFEKGKKYLLGQDNGTTAAPVWSGCFTVPVVDIQVCLSISYDPTTPTVITLCLSADGAQTCLNVDVADFACIPIGIPDLVDLQVCFDNWQVQPSSISFNITVKVCALICITVYSFGPITIPTEALGKYRKGELSAEDTKLLKKALLIQQRLTGGTERKSSACACHD